MHSKIKVLLVNLVLVSLPLVGCAPIDETTKADQGPGPTPAEAIAKGDKAVGEGNTDAALTYYVQALEKEPKNDVTLVKVAAIHEAKGNAALAEDAYKLAAAAAPQNANAREGLGLLQFQRHDYGQAERNLQAAVALDARRWRSYNALGLISDQKQAFGPAQFNYLKALSIEPNSPMLVNNLGYSKYLAGELQDAQEQFSKALTLDPKYERAILNMGLVLARTGHDDEALTTFKQIMDEAAAYNNLGYIAMLNKKYADAEEYFERSITLSPAYNEQANQNLVHLQELKRKHYE